MWRRDVRPPSDWGNQKTAAVAGADFENSCDDATLPLICPTCQIPFSTDY